ncbi:MAG: chromosome segregation protein SMC [Clostridia bacterium]|nr:chromosome segregation protein SMC [Clostridia bacterium]
MYLKSLELHGFKSFPNKTVMTFERGTTIIVGPNGSGKSNISDAMRWVLGELSSRNIRGTKMEDVIFGGTDTRKPMGFAEVSVTFDNSDEKRRIDSPYDEITVTRRYYRTGDSEYMINRKNCRLKDIYELFMNTGIGREGYSIIGQGKIAEILSKKSEDRRHIFEEAAGISKFRQRKEETEKKLNETLSFMENATLIFNELDARIGPLSREAEKAKKYRELLERKKEADVSLWLFDTQKIKVDLKKAEETLSLARAEYERVVESIESLEKQDDHVREQLTGSRLESERLIREITDATKRLAELEKEYSVTIGEIRHMQELAEESQRQFGRLDEADVSLAESKKQNQAALEELTKQEEDFKDEQLVLLAAREDALRAAKQLEEALEAELKEIEALHAQEMDIRVRLDFSKKEKEEGKGKGEELLREVELLREKDATLQQDLERCDKSTRSYREKIAKAEEDIATLAQNLEELQQEKEAQNRLLNEENAKKSGLEQRIDALQRMEEHFEGYQQSVRFVMQAYGQNPSQFKGKIYGPVSHLISVEKEYITAIETALGQSMQNIAVENEETAKSAIFALKQAGAGRATFYPLNAIRSAGITSEIKEAMQYRGYVGRADELVTYDPMYQTLIEYLLLRTVVFEDIDTATEAAKKMHYKVRIVTLDGQIINVGAAFTGGSAKKDSGILSRGNHIETLQKEVASLEVKIAEMQKGLKKIETDILLNQAKSAELTQAKDLLYNMSRAQLSEYERVKAAKEGNQSLLEKLQEDYTRLTESGGKYESDIALLEQELSAIIEQIDAKRALRAEQEVQRHAALDKKEEMDDAITDLRVRFASLDKDKETIANALENTETEKEQHKREREEISARIAEYTARSKSMEEENEANRKEAEQISLLLQRLEEERTDSQKDAEEYNRRESELREKIRSANEEKERAHAHFSRAELSLGKYKEENERLETKLFDEYQITYEEAVSLPYAPVTAENRATVAAVQASCKSEIRSLGNVNTGAIEEYAEVGARHETLKQQLEDLEKAKEQLLDTIKKVEEEMQTNFVEAFNTINENFGTVFGELFGGGEAELSLTNPEDVLTSGIEIKAAPPGKIIKSLSLLSGGEQTFVAIALIFAILKANPTPFCIFDEIEAALDEVNVDRFGAYVTKLSEETQFVLITHRRGTMEIADRLYGITMPERGISRALLMEISEIESKQKELLE